MPDAEHDRRRSWIEEFGVGEAQERAHRESQKHTGKSTPVVNEEIVLLIRYRYWRKGWSQKQIAEEMGLRPTTVSSIIRSRSWKHVYLPEDWEPSGKSSS